MDVCVLIKEKKEDNGIDVDGRCGGIFGMVFGGFAFLLASWCIFDYAPCSGLSIFLDVPKFIGSWGLELF